MRDRVSATCTFQVHPDIFSTINLLDKQSLREYNCMRADMKVIFFESFVSHG